MGQIRQSEPLGYLSLQATCRPGSETALSSYSSWGDADGNMQIVSVCVGISRRVAAPFSISLLLLRSKPRRVEVGRNVHVTGVVPLFFFFHSGLTH